MIPTKKHLVKVVWTSNELVITAVKDLKNIEKNIWAIDIILDGKGNINIGSFLMTHADISLEVVLQEYRMILHKNFERKYTENKEFIHLV